MFPWIRVLLMVISLQPTAESTSYPAVSVVSGCNQETRMVDGTGGTMNRRGVMSGGLAVGIAAAVGVAPSAAQQDDRTDDRTAAAVDQLRVTIAHSTAVSPELVAIREQQRAFLKANHKFPDFIEVGIGVWEGVCDWHVRHQLPVEILRNAEGRYTIAVIGTTLLLRPEQADTFVGFGFDAR